jgi:molecular chaperone DnaK
MKPSPWAPAIQGQVLGGERKDVLLLDVTPLSLGIETLGGVMTKMIHEEHDHPDQVRADLLHGRRQPAGRDHQGLPGRARHRRGQQAAGRVQPGRHPAGSARPAPDRGELRHRRQRHPARGAKDKATGKENKITIKANSGISEEEIQKMVKDAELNAAEDKKKLEIVQAKNQGEALVHSVSKSLTEYGEKLDAGEKEKIEAALKDVEEALKGEDKTAIEEKTNALMTASQKLGEKMYADMQAQQAAQAAGAAAAWREQGRRPSRPTTMWSTPRSRKSRRADAQGGPMRRITRRVDAIPCGIVNAAFRVKPRQRWPPKETITKSSASQERLGRRNQEGLSQAGDEAPP